MNHVGHPESQNSVELAEYSDCPALTAEYPQGKGLNLMILWTHLPHNLVHSWIPNTNGRSEHRKEKILFPELHFEFLNVAEKKRKDEFYIS